MGVEKLYLGLLILAYTKTEAAAWCNLGKNRKPSQNVNGQGTTLRHMRIHQTKHNSNQSSYLQVATEPRKKKRTRHEGATPTRTKIKTLSSYRLVDAGKTIISRQDVLQGLMLTLSVQMTIAAASSQPCWSAETSSVELKECIDGAIVPENAIPGAYQQVCMTLPQRTIPLKAIHDTVLVAQGDAVGAGRTGVAVWNSCLLLTRLLDSLTLESLSSSSSSSLGNNTKTTKYNWLSNKTVVELGCGTGLASIAAAKLGAFRVLATDGNADVVQLAQSNIELNHINSKTNNTTAAPICTTATLQWGFLDAIDYANMADLMIGSDLTYNAGTWKNLAETIGTVLKPGGIMLYLSLGHSGFNVNGELQGFLSVASTEGLEVLESEGNTVGDWPLPVPSVSKLLDQCATKEEQDVLKSTGGARVIVLRKKVLPKAK